MIFKRDGADICSGELNLTEEDHGLLLESLTRRVLFGEPVEDDTPTTRVVNSFLGDHSPEEATTLRVVAYKEQVDVMLDVVRDNTDIAPEQIEHAAGFIKELEIAARLIVPREQPPTDLGFN